MAQLLQQNRVLHAWVSPFHPPAHGSPLLSPASPIPELTGAFTTSPSCQCCYRDPQDFLEGLPTFLASTSSRRCQHRAVKGPADAQGHEPWD